MGGEKGVQSSRQEALQVVSERIGCVGKRVNIHAVPHPSRGRQWRQPWTAVPRISGIRRADGNGMATAAKLAGDHSGHARDTTVGPGVVKIRRDVKYTKRHICGQFDTETLNPSEL